MKKLRFLLLLMTWSALVSLAAGATLPTGTTLVVRTTDSISSHEKSGRTFRAKLDHDVAVKGNVVLKAGTPCTGVVEGSRGDYHRTSPLTLNLTSITVRGNRVPVKTAGPFQLEPRAKTARQSRGGFSVGETTFAAGARLEFRLAQPLNL